MEPSVTTADIAVLGLGAMGAAVLYQLSRHGANVVGIDRFAPPHDQGSSHGETRITRQAAGEGGAYAPLVLRSHVIWRQLEADTGLRLLETPGFLVIGPTTGPSSHHGKEDFLQTTTEIARRFGIAHEALSRAELIRRFPQFSGLGDADAGYWEPGGGFLHPERCIAAQLAQARLGGARIMSGVRATGIRQAGAVVRIDMDGGAIEAAQVVVAAGSWTGPLLGAPFDRLLRVTRQVMHWFASEAPDAYRPDRFPVFIRMHGPGDSDYFYGFPTAGETGGVKVATEQYKSATRADRFDRIVHPEEAGRMHQAHVAGRLAGIPPHPLRSMACLYTSTPDSDFLIDTHPAMDRVTVVSACSGHGFKHSAAIGQAVTERVLTGRSAIDLRPFSLARFASGAG